LDTPGKVIQQVSSCRVVVTGSYHGGVFALAQGIPIVGLVKSEYYVGKFLGLAEQFGGIGCQIVSLNDENFPEKLKRSVDNAWQSAETVRPQLLELARQQIDQGLNAYRRVYELLS
ncbi:MAG: polysaccharide pyruvyl transferase family protein, partial [Gemmatimonadaceae bacterium]|nr:polysaccharide pyruvyl transferase family protein [Gloeobacterales cyanobacterium ES-bin-141]